MESVSEEGEVQKKITEPRLWIDHILPSDRISFSARKWTQRGAGALIAFAAYEANYDVTSIETMASGAITKIVAFYAGSFTLIQPSHALSKFTYEQSLDNRGDL